jgi:hypothetical protein
MPTLACDRSRDLGRTRSSVSLKFPSCTDKQPVVRFWSAEHAMHAPRTGWLRATDTPGRLTYCCLAKTSTKLVQTGWGVFIFALTLTPTPKPDISGRKPPGGVRFSAPAERNRTQPNDFGRNNETATKVRQNATRRWGGQVKTAYHCTKANKTERLRNSYDFNFAVSGTYDDSSSNRSIFVRAESWNSGPKTEQKFLSTL